MVQKKNAKKAEANPISKLVKTLNKKQLAYTDLNLKDPRNGEYLLSVFHLIPGKNLNILQAACEVAAESSTGTNFKVKY
jgi:ribulose-bisphosphate carboxylase large chain